MSKSDDAKMAKLVKKLSAQAGQPKKDLKRRQYDPTLRPELMEEDTDLRNFFSEMKKREF